MSEKVYVVYDSPIKAWVSTFASSAATALLIGLGVYLESAAMQWLGFVFIFIILFGWATRKKGRGMTREEAIADLKGERHDQV